MAKNPNTYTGKCPECSSTIKLIEGVFKCTEDRLEGFAQMFREWERSGKQVLIEASKHSNMVKDLAECWVKVEPDGSRPYYYCTFNPNQVFNPMTENKTFIGDPIQQYIAEQLLGRALYEDEKRGYRKVPLINQDGEKYVGAIDQLEYPKDFTPEYIDKLKKIDLEKLPQPIDWEKLHSEK